MSKKYVLRRSICGKVNISENLHKFYFHRTQFLYFAVWNYGGVRGDSWTLFHRSATVKTLDCFSQAIP